MPDSTTEKTEEICEQSAPAASTAGGADVEPEPTTAAEQKADFEERDGEKAVIEESTEQIVAPEESAEEKLPEDASEEVVPSPLKPADSVTSLPDITISDIRKAKSIGSVASSDAGDLSTFSDSDFEAIISDPDSDVEFEQYLKETATRRRKNYIKEHLWHLETKRTKQEPRHDKIEDEYENLPDFEKLTISCPETTKLAKFGVVHSVVGYVAMIRPHEGITQILDLDSVIFDKDGNSIGSVFDIVGTVHEALYCIRFGSKTEASQIPVGLDVFYAPAAEDFTKKLIEKNLKSAWKKGDVAAESEEDEAVFSDDEKEKEYRERKRAEKNGGNGGQQGRKRNHNRSVHFGDQGPNPGAQHAPRGGRGGRGGGRGGRGGGGRGGGWQQRGTFQPAAESSSPSGVVVPESVKSSVPARAAQVTADNPYAEFGCYATYTGIETAKTVYKRS